MRVQITISSIFPRDRCSPLPTVGKKRSIEQLLSGINDAILGERADGLVLDAVRGEIFIVEVARTSDDPCVIYSLTLTKHTKYTGLGRKALLNTRVVQLTFVIGIQGTIDEELWIYQRNVWELQAVDRRNYYVSGSQR